MTRADELRAVLAEWGTYGPWFDAHGNLIGYRHEPIPVDTLTDDEIIAIAREIATGSGDAA